MKYEIAGDPISGLKWTRKTAAKIATELRSLEIEVSPNTVARLLKQMDIRLRVNHKKLSTGSTSDRDEQFRYIAQLRQKFEREGLPIVSVDAKKRELVGNFKNPGAVLGREAILVNDHDFRSEAKGIAIPHGVFDCQANWAAVSVGVSHDTSEFAVESIARWWREDGRSRYPHARELLILADSGGSNSSTRRTWKYALQTRLCDRYGLNVTVAHYPPGTSKWNPIEHRVFSEISKNWAGHPLVSYETILNFINTTRTSTGLEVKAYLDPTTYQKSVKISDQQMRDLDLRKHDALPKRNYTLAPRHLGA